MVGKTVRVTSPSRSRPLSVKVSIRCEMLPSPRRSSLKRFDPSPSRVTTSTVHLSPTRASTSLTARQSSGTWRLLGISDVPSCRGRVVIYLALVSNHNQGTPNMPKIKIAVLVGSNRRESINRKLAQAIAAELMEQVASNARQQVIAFQRGLAHKAHHDRQPRFWAFGHADGNRAVEFDDWTAHGWRQLRIESADARPVSNARRPRLGVAGDNGRMEVVKAARSSKLARSPKCLDAPPD